MRKQLRRTAVAAAVGAAVALLSGPVAGASASAPPRLLFQNTNPDGANAVQVYSVARDGALEAGPLVPTGGAGTGASLGNQGGVVLAGRLLLVVNAGDDTVSAFGVGRSGLRLRGVVPSGGDTPVSVTVHDDLAYVLNAGSDSVHGFRIRDGRLVPIAGSSRPLGGTAVGAAQIRFDASGRALVVSERATNSLTTFRVDRDGRAQDRRTTPSVGAVPFGFDIDRRNTVVVSEAAPGALSSYRLTGTRLRVVTGGLADTQRAACWVELTRDGRFAFTTNAASATVSSYAVGRDGSLTLLAAVAARTAAGPTDLAESSDGRHLFVRVASGAVESYAVGPDGSLTPAGSARGAAAFGTSGLAAS